jgi:hypothetical protein
MKNIGKIKPDFNNQNIITPDIQELREKSAQRMMQAALMIKGMEEEEGGKKKRKRRPIKVKIEGENKPLEEKKPINYGDEGNEVDQEYIDYQDKKLQEPRGLESDPATDKLLKDILVKVNPSLKKEWKTAGDEDMALAEAQVEAMENTDKFIDEKYNEIVERNKKKGEGIVDGEVKPTIEKEKNDTVATVEPGIVVLDGSNNIPSPEVKTKETVIDFVPDTNTAEAGNKEETSKVTEGIVDEIKKGLGKKTEEVEPSVKVVDNDTEKKDTDVKKEITGEEISKRAYKIYLERQEKGIDGSQESDWQEAERQLKQEQEEKESKEKEAKEINEPKVDGTNKPEKKDDLKNDIVNILTKEEEKDENLEINNKLGEIGLKNEDLENNEDWQKFSKAEKLLIIEQMSQDTLSRVKEIGEKRFQEKNAIKFSWNPANWRLSAARKIWNKFGKAYWISKEEKEVIDEVKRGGLKPNMQVVETLIEKQSELGLNVVEKNGKAFIEFAQGNNNLSPEQKKIIDDYNETANSFSKLPVSWRNEKPAKSTEKLFGKGNYKKYQEARATYEFERSNLIEMKVEQYKADGLDELEAKSKAMNDLVEMDRLLSLLQFTNTNPDALEELKKIKNESSWGRLVNNENIWRSIYMAGGFVGRKATIGVFGVLAAPITAGAIGGIRARRKAIANINRAFKEGVKEETFLERREHGKKGLYDDKNEGQGLISKTLSGKKVNTKEVAAFVDADSQKQRLDNLIGKINNEQEKTKRDSFVLQLEARIRYIEEKEQQGLISYGSKNPTAKNYELYKTMSEAYVISRNINNLEIKMTREMESDILERDALLKRITEKNEEVFGKKIAEYKRNEIVRGAMVAAGFSILGRLVKGILHHHEAIAGTTTTNEANVARASDLHDSIHPGEKPITVEFSSRGGIQTVLDMKEAIHHRYPVISKAPAELQEFVKTDATHEAIKLGFYNPNDPSGAESINVEHGSTLTFDKKGLSMHDIRTGENQVYGSEHKFEGKMFDSDHSGVKVEGVDNPQEIPNPNNDTFINPEDPSTYENFSANNLDTTIQPIDVSEVNGEVNIPGQGLDQTQETVYRTGLMYDHHTNNTIDSHSSNVHKPTVDAKTSHIAGNLSQEQLSEQLDNAYQNNINHLFPTKELMSNWSSIKNIPVEKLMALHENKELAENLEPLVRHIKHLEKVTHIKPLPATGDMPAETIGNLLHRTIEKAQQMGKLNRVKL